MSSDPLHDREFLTSLRRDMLRFAEMQLRDRAQAEDAVQEALAGALMGKEKFASRASLRTLSPNSTFRSAVSAGLPLVIAVLAR